MESLRESIHAMQAQEAYVGETMKRPENEDKPRIWSVIIVASVSECKIDGEYVAVRKAVRPDFYFQVLWARS
jgi:hypothetical protein